MGTCSSFPEQSREEVKLPTHLFYLVPTLRMRGSIPLLPLYGFTTSTQTLPLWHLQTWGTEVLVHKLVTSALDGGLW